MKIKTRDGIMVEPSPEKVRQNEIWMEELASGERERRRVWVQKQVKYRIGKERLRKSPFTRTLE